MANDQILQGLPEGVQNAIATATQPKYGNPAPVAPQPAAIQPPNAVPGNGDDAPDVGTQPHPLDTMASAFVNLLVSKDAAANANIGQPAAPPPDAKAPGSFGQKLAGAVSALGSGLGDMRTGGDPSKGHGWLGAVGATLDARNQRIDRQKQQQFDNQERLKNDTVNIALANSNLRQHALAIQQAEKSIRDEAATEGSQFVDTLRDNYQVTDKISQDQLNNMVSKDPNYLKTHTARITGYEPVLDADGKQKMVGGKPVESPLWSLVDLSPGDASKQYTVNATQSKKWADAGLHQIPTGTRMPATVANDLNMQAERYGTTLSLLNLGKVQPLPDSVKEQMVGALQDKEVQHAVAMHPGAPLSGLYAAQDVVAQHLDAAQQQLAAAQQGTSKDAIAAAQDKVKDIQTTQANLDTTINQGFTDAERSAYAKQTVADAKEDAIEAKNQRTEDETERNHRKMEQIDLYKAMHPNGGALAGGGGANGDIPISDGMQQQLDSLRSANPSAAAILDHYDNTAKAAIMSVAFGDGSVDFKTTFPARLTKGAPGLNAQQAVGVLRQINPNWTEQQYNNTRDAYKTATTGKNANAIQQYNNFLQHAAGAVDALSAANRQGPRVWNTALNKLENAGYGTDATKIQAALSGPREEISLLLSGGYKPDAAEHALITTILNDAATPSQLSAALQEYAKLGTIRLNNINENYMRSTGKNLPRIISPETLAAAKHLNVDPLSMNTLSKLDSTGTIFGPQTPAGANAPQVGAKKTFPNGAVGVWDGKGYVAQPPQQ